MAPPRSCRPSFKLASYLLSLRATAEASLLHLPSRLFHLLSLFLSLTLSSPSPSSISLFFVRFYSFFLHLFHLRLPFFLALSNPSAIRKVWNRTARGSLPLASSLLCPRGVIRNWVLLHWTHLRGGGNMLPRVVGEFFGEFFIPHWRIACVHARFGLCARRFAALKSEISF